jgi:ABC-type transporter Mla subunit MlaD
MTTERWTDDMLDRLASTTTRLLTNITTISEQNARDISRLEGSVERLANIAEVHQQTLEMHQQNFNAVLGEMREIQVEVRGLQTENRRILDQMINRNDEDNPI